MGTIRGHVLSGHTKVFAARGRRHDPDRAAQTEIVSVWWVGVLLSGFCWVFEPDFDFNFDFLCCFFRQFVWPQMDLAWPSIVFIVFCRGDNVCLDVRLKRVNWF